MLEGVRSGKWATTVGRVGSSYAKAFEKAKAEGHPDPTAVAKKSVHKLKQHLPAMTFSGTFRERNDNAIETHSGILCIDADNCAQPENIRAKLASDSHVQAAFISPTWTGCKALVRIPKDARTHAGLFLRLRSTSRKRTA